jgi:hypothetical protein
LHTIDRLSFVEDIGTSGEAYARETCEYNDEKLGDSEGCCCCWTLEAGVLGNKLVLEDENGEKQDA